MTDTSRANAFSHFPEVRISPAGMRRLRQGHLWIYATDVDSEPTEPPTPLVQLIDGARNILGYAFYSPLSQIRLRLLVRGPTPPTPDLLRARIEASIKRRAGSANTNTACRLIYGEADLLPSIIVDRYGEYLVLQTLSHGSDAVKPILTDILLDLIKPAGILERNDVKARTLEGLPLTQHELWGNIPDEVEISESGIRFLVDLKTGQKTGFFLDQAENRAAAAGYAQGRALDCFTNTGAFALHFARRCESVLAADSSADALTQARRNAELNGLANIEFREGNVFDCLRELEARGDRFDTICLDPPAFAKTRSALDSARAGYKEINLRALKVLKPEGILITCSCSYHLQETAFFELLREAARDAHRYIQVLERRGQSRDHPILAGMPETHYLKCLVVRSLG
jgi:23S rRNA (cytosine1962-C5)-methyltransferase